MNPGKINSSWNIAADFKIDMSFSEEEIADMLWEYEADTHTSMDVCMMAKLLYDYTSGYPFLVSRLCKLNYYGEQYRISQFSHGHLIG